jgi:hypothetical protein
MTTTNDGGPAHPMVMKAARALSDRSADACGISREVQWAVSAAQFIADAHASLTECGALECLKALIHVHDNLGGGGADEWVVMEDFDIQIVEDAINSAGIEI